MISIKEVKNNYKIDKKEIDHDLNNKYVELLNDESFEKIVKDLHMSNDELLRHSYELEKCLIEQKNCTKCKNINECKNKVLGFKYTCKNIDGNINYSYEMCKKKSDLAKNISSNVYSIDIPEQIKNASMKDIYLDDRSRLDVIKKIKCFIDNYGKKKQKGLYIHGNFGGGKTYLVSALFNELGKNNIKSAIVYYPELLRNLKNFSEDFDEKYNYLKKVPLLLLDDIGAENVTGWNRDEILGPLLQYRMDENLPTFFTSNLNINELENHFSMTYNNEDKVKARRIIERILVVSEPIEMISQNKRN